eukprot:jgi/Bigna1/73997/fgenesh1_pg.27_\
MAGITARASGGCIRCSGSLAALTVLVTTAMQLSPFRPPILAANSCAKVRPGPQSRLHKDVKKGQWEYQLRRKFKRIGNDIGINAKCSVPLSLEEQQPCSNGARLTDYQSGALSILQVQSRILRLRGGDRREGMDSAVHDPDRERTGNMVLCLRGGSDGRGPRSEAAQDNRGRFRNNNFGSQSGGPRQYGRRTRRGGGGGRFQRQRKAQNSTDKSILKLGDWICPTCYGKNFAMRTESCFRCQADKPENIQTMNALYEEGKLNFSSERQYDL